MDKRNVGTKGKSPKQGLANAKDLPIELLEGREFSFHRFDKLINLTYSLIYGPWGRYFYWYYYKFTFSITVLPLGNRTQ